MQLNITHNVVDGSSHPLSREQAPADLFPHGRVQQNAENNKFLGGRSVNGFHGLRGSITGLPSSEAVKSFPPLPGTAFLVLLVTKHPEKPESNCVLCKACTSSGRLNKQTQEHRGHELTLLAEQPLVLKGRKRWGLLFKNKKGFSYPRQLIKFTNEIRSLF